MENTLIKVKKGYRPLREKKRFYALMLAIPLLNFVLFYLFVNINSILLAFQQFDMSTGLYTGFGFDNFRRVWFNLRNESVFNFAFKNSIIVYLVSIFAGTPLTLLFSYYLHKKMRLHKMFRVMLFMPALIPSIVLVLIFKYFTERAYPEISWLLTGNETAGLLQGIDTVMPTLIFYMVWAGFGVGVLMYSGAMDGIDDSVVESAHLDGATGLKEFVYITFPLIYPTFVTFMVASVAGLFTNQFNLYSFFGVEASMRISTFGYYLFKETYQALLSDYPFLSAIGLMLTAIAVPLALLIKYGLEKIGYKQD